MHSTKNTDSSASSASSSEHSLGYHNAEDLSGSATPSDQTGAEKELSVFVQMRPGEDNTLRVTVDASKLTEHERRRRIKRLLEGDRESLQQGDVIRRSPGVEAVLREVHPHYFNKPDYRFFIVLTQSCDLARRAGQPSAARYVTVAAVRPLSLAIERYIAQQQFDELESRLGFASEDRKEKLRQFVERVMNNNEDSYFFLRAEPTHGLDEDHCAFLQLSIALKADLHYDTLLAAKILQLQEPFQHKLGYLVGTSYSRVGTEDWVPKHLTAEDFNKAVQERIAAAGSVLWLERTLHRQLLPPRFVGRRQARKDRFEGCHEDKKRSPRLRGLCSVGDG